MKNKFIGNDLNGERMLSITTKEKFLFGLGYCFAVLALVSLIVFIIGGC